MIYKEMHLPQAYKEHIVFEDLKIVEDTYDFLSDNSIGFVADGLPGQWVNYQTYVFSSLGRTIDSMHMLLECAHINDAFALLRKYFDEVMIAVFYSAVAKDQVEAHKKKLLYTVEKLKNWLEGKSQTPKYDNIIKYLERSSSFKELMGKFAFEEDKGFGRIRRYLDDNMHINRYRLLLNNDNEIYNSRRVKLLTTFRQCVDAIFAFHFASILYLNGIYMLATDYRDYMDLGEVPHEGSENWPAQQAQIALDRFVKPMPSITAFLKEHTFLEFEWL